MYDGNSLTTSNSIHPELKYNNSRLRLSVAERKRLARLDVKKLQHAQVRRAARDDKHRALSIGFAYDIIDNDDGSDSSSIDSSNGNDCDDARVRRSSTRPKHGRRRKFQAERSPSEDSSESDHDSSRRKRSRLLQRRPDTSSSATSLSPAGHDLFEPVKFPRRGTSITQTSRQVDADLFDLSDIGEPPDDLDFDDVDSIRGSSGTRGGSQGSRMWRSLSKRAATRCPDIGSPISTTNDSESLALHRLLYPDSATSRRSITLFHDNHPHSPLLTPNVFTAPSISPPSVGSSEAAPPAGDGSYIAFSNSWFADAAVQQDTEELRLPATSLQSVTVANHIGSNSSRTPPLRTQPAQQSPNTLRSLPSFATLRQSQLFESMSFASDFDELEDSPVPLRSSSLRPVSTNLPTSSQSGLGLGLCSLAISPAEVRASTTGTEAAPSPVPCRRNRYTLPRPKARPRPPGRPVQTSNVEAPSREIPKVKEEVLLPARAVKREPGVVIVIDSDTDDDDAPPQYRIENDVIILD